MTTPVWNSPKDTDNVPLILAGWLFLALVGLAAITGVWRVTSALAGPPYDTTTFCEGYETGGPYAYSLAGIDPATVPPDVMPNCPPAAATRGFDELTSWCEGLSQAMLQVALDLDTWAGGNSDTVKLAFVTDMTAACIEMNTEAAEESDAPLGGGGPAPLQN